MLIARNYRISLNFIFFLLFASSIIFQSTKNIVYGENLNSIGNHVFLTAKSTSSDLLTQRTEEFFPKQPIDNNPLVDAETEIEQFELNKILTRYYERCLGGTDNWNSIYSFKISGELHTEDGKFEYKSIFKKPNLYKIAISQEEKKNIIAFDGNNKWQKQLSGEEWSYPEVTPQMRRMFHEPELATYLLNPYQKDKIIEFKGTVRQSNAICFRISLSIEQGYLIDYFIDVESYHIASIEIIDKLEYFSPVLINYSDYRLVDGAYFAHKINYYIDGQWDSMLHIRNIFTNVGAAQWMFNFREKLL